ncbi:MAG: hypothetical protein IID33_04565 [Planctomycetes bacterium]|nr:hypothetical protein [Planctomycetota bacterium]
MIKKALVTLAAGGALLASAAQADIARPGDVKATAERAAPSNWVFGSHMKDPYCDDFDSYTPGDICPQHPNWVGWAGNGAVCSVVSTEQANSGANSLLVVGDGSSGTPGDDQVYLYDIVGGVWTFSIMTYVPRDAVGEGYLIMLNTYRPPYLPTDGLNWSLQVHFNAGTNLIVADFNLEQTPMIKGQWVEFRAEIDMPNDSVDYFYDNVEFVTDKSWKDGVSNNGAGTSTIAALDLYGNEPPGGISALYYDDMQLVEQGESCGCAFDPADMNCDGVVDALDIEPFICLLFDPNCVPCSSCAGDVNGDGTVNAEDIEPFINILFP